MKKKYLIVLCFCMFLIIFSPSSYSSPLYFQNLVASLESSLVTVLAFDLQGNLLEKGIGFFIGTQGELITSNHILSEALKVKVKTTSGELFPVKQVLAFDPENNLIKLQVAIPEEKYNPLRINSANLRTGEKVLIISNSWDLEKELAEALVATKYKEPSLGDMVQITLALTNKAEGSLVVNMLGEVVGLVTKQFHQGQYLKFVLAAEKILQMKTVGNIPFDEWQLDYFLSEALSFNNFYSLGFQAIEENDFQKALYYFQEIIKNQPHEFLAHLYTGLCQHELGNYISALNSYKEAIYLEPTYPDTYFYLGDVYLLLGYYPDAIAAYNEAKLLKPNSGEGHCKLGLVNLLLNSPREALKDFEKAISLEPNSPIAYYGLGLAYLDLESANQAIVALNTATTINPFFYEAYTELGRAYFLENMFEQALNALEHSIALEPNFPESHLYLCLTYLMMDEEEAALKEYYALISLDPFAADLVRSYLD